MARRPVQQSSKKSTVALEKPVLPARSLETTVELLKNQSAALQMSAEGYSHREIAEALDIGIARVPKLLSEALGELVETRNKAADKFFALHRRRYDLLIRTWMRKAMGYSEEVENVDGARVEVVHPPDPKAAMIMAKLQADYAKMFGFNKLRVEHTGAHGGPIMNFNANVDWSKATNEQLAQAASGDTEVIRQLSGGSGGAYAGGGSTGDPSSRRGQG